MNILDEFKHRAKIAKMRHTLIAVLSTALLAVAITTALPVQTRPQPAQAQQASDKYDGDCTGTETAGRCADKCPNPTDTVLGYDKETGAVVCKPAPTGCPYGDSITLGPDCDKHAPAATVTPAQPQAALCEGK